MALNIFKKKTPKANMSQTPAAPVQSEPSAAGVATGKMPGSNESVLKNFYVSEKSTRLAAMNQYVFRVSPDATKSEIAKAVHARYGVTVTAVMTITIPRKARTVGRHSGFRSGFKKAIVILRTGETIAQAQP